MALGAVCRSTIEPARICTERLEAAGDVSRVRSEEESLPAARRSGYCHRLGTNVAAFGSESFDESVEIEGVLTDARSGDAVLFARKTM